MSDDVLLKEQLSLRIFKDILSPENVTVSNEMRRLLRVPSKDKKMVDETFLWVGLPAGSVRPWNKESLGKLVRIAQQRS
jgi:hypothetical protein